MKPSQIKWAIIWGLALMCVTVFAFVPIVEASYEETNLKLVTETIYVSEEYTETEEYTSLEDNTQNLFGDAKFSLIYGRKVYSTYIDVEEKSNCTLSGSIAVFETANCSFYVIGEDYYTSHSSYETYPPEETLVAIPTLDTNQITVFSFTPDVSDTYYFIFTPIPPFENWTTEGRNEFSALYEFQQEVTLTREVTKYRDVPKEVTQEKEVTETITKRVSILDYLLNYN